MVQAFRLSSGISLLLLAACSAPSQEYPTLAVRDIERTGGTMEVEPAPPPAPPPASTLSSLDDLAQAARAAHSQFLAAAPRARSVVASAAGAARGSERWSQAQVAIADLEAQRSQTMIALADLDRIFVAAATSGQATDSISAVRGEIDALVEEQNALIGNLLATVAG